MTEITPMPPKTADSSSDSLGDEQIHAKSFGGCPILLASVILLYKQLCFKYF